MRRADLAALTAFVTVADKLSFRAAASRLGVTPSALSHSMRQLEETVRGLGRGQRDPTDAETGREHQDEIAPRPCPPDHRHAALDHRLVNPDHLG